MSRSQKKHPAGGCTIATSEKQDKSLSARAWRRLVRVALSKGQEPPHEKEIRNPWDWDKDGRQRFGAALSPQSLKEAMRK